MTALPVDPELIEFARVLADAARRITMRWFRASELSIERKPDGSIVTVADLEAERAMRTLILRERPGDGIVGEELGTVASTTGMTWTLDPIDGTLSFVHGVPLFSTLVALSDEAGPAAGVIQAPALDEEAVAGRGHGCRVNGVAARTSSTASLADAVVVTSGLADYWPGPTLARILSSGALVRTWADGGYGYILLASGRIDAMVDGVVEPWDMAAATCVIPEAGGRAGTVPVGDGVGFLATNENLHEDVSVLL